MLLLLNPTLLQAVCFHTTVIGACCLVEFKFQSSFAYYQTTAESARIMRAVPLTLGSVKTCRESLTLQALSSVYAMLDAYF